MIIFILYKGKPVRVSDCAKEEFDAIQLDARRIMGMAPVEVFGISSFPMYLESPKENSKVWKYAMRILALEWPVAKIWLDGNYRFVELSKLEAINTQLLEFANR